MIKFTWMDMLLILGMLSLMLLCFAFLLYATARYLALGLARLNRKESTRPFLLLLVLEIVIVPLEILALMFGAKEAGCGMFALALYCLYGWATVLRQRKKERVLRQQYFKAHPTPKWQFRIYDFWAVAAAFGLVMVILRSALGLSTSLANLPGGVALKMIVYAVLAFFGVSAGFFVAMDVCRREELSAFQRCCVVLFVGALSGIPFTLPVVLLSWITWRYAVWKARAEAEVFPDETVAGVRETG